MELLSPVGGFEALYAAVSAGADAVYLGGKDFSARQSAQNFDEADLARAIHYCQKRGVKAYITINTLMSDRELKELAPFLALIYKEGADGVIVQDLGVSRLIHQQLSDLPIHGSTQMTIHTLEGAKALEQMGFSRVVLSRELGLQQIKHICENCNIEVEVFAHGALCVSYSGQCLMSSMIGGRSGNRGRCAQPCRLQYQLEGKKGAMLSLKDLSLINHIKELNDTGVDCLKIEGRMKGAEYISVVTSVYRKAIDQKKVSKDDIKKLESVFYRGGYTDGYFTGKIAQDMYAVDKPDNPYLRQTKYQLPLEKEPRFGERIRKDVIVQVPKINYKNRKKLTLTAQVTTIEQLQSVYQFGIMKVFVPAELIIQKADLMDLTQVVCVMPRIGFHETQMKKVKELGVMGACASNIGQIKPLIDMGFEVVGDFSLNIFNSQALLQAKELGIKEATLSTELMLAQIRDIAKSIPTQVIAYGRLPLMLFENPPKGKELIDRKGVVFPLLGNELLNSCPIYMADKLEDMKEAGIREAKLLFTIESAKETEKVLKAYRKQVPFEGEFTRGKFYKGV